MAKETTAKTHEDAKTAVEAAGASRKEAKAALNSFLQENELRKNVDHSGKLEQPGLQKKYDKLRAAWTSAKELETTAKANEKDSRPRKERETKYNYPSDCTTGGDRKKFRAACRAGAKRAKVELADYLENPSKYEKAADEAKAKKSAEKAEKAEKAKAKKSEKKADTPKKDKKEKKAKKDKATD
tara:strand:+ start:24070 stop:24621 length:552 start_codon:yes stop_codon:yes gene_type:complete